MRFGFNLRLEDTQAHNGLAHVANRVAVAGRVVRSLRGKGRKPYYCVKSIDAKHDVRLGNLSCPWPSRSHYEVNPTWDRKEALHAWLCISKSAERWHESREGGS